MSRKSPAFSFYPDSWIGGTFYMDSEEKGVYIDLLAMSWIRNGLSTKEARKAGPPNVVDKVLSDKFEHRDGLWFNVRIEEERAKQESNKAKRKAAGERRAKSAKRGASGKFEPAQAPAQAPAQSPANGQHMGPAKNQLSDSVSESSKEDSLGTTPPMPADGQAASPQGRVDCRMDSAEVAREKKIRAAVATGLTKAEAVKAVDA